MAKRNRQQTTKPTAQAAETTNQPTTDLTATEVANKPHLQVPDHTPDVQPEPAPNDPMARIMQKAAEMAAKPTKSAPKSCACGCGLMTRGGTWYPGHNGLALKKALQEIRQQQASQPLTLTAGQSVDLQ